MKYDLEFAKKQVADLDRFRTARALSGMSQDFQRVFQLISLLLHCNHPNLPGYISEAPAGICHLELSDYQRQYLDQSVPHLDFSQIESFSDRTFNAVYGVYVMGSVASVCQTSYSDLDIWVCHREDLNQQERDKLQQKASALQCWAKGYAVEINLF